MTNNESASTEYKSLFEIWDSTNEPFIAKNDNGWFVMITLNPYNQKEKYHGTIYGRIQKDYELLYMRSSTRAIMSAEDKVWKFVEVAIDY